MPKAKGVKPSIAEELSISREWVLRKLSRHRRILKKILRLIVSGMAFLFEPKRIEEYLILTGQFR